MAATKKRSTKKSATPVKVPKDPVDEALKKVVHAYFENDLPAKMKPEADKAVATMVGRSHASVKPTYNGIEVALCQKLGFGREINGRLVLTTEFYGQHDSLLKAVKGGIKESKKHRMDSGYYVGKPVYDAMKFETDVSFACGSRSATEALGQAEQIRVMAHALLALETFLEDILNFRVLGDNILEELKAAKKAAKAETTAAAV